MDAYRLEDEEELEAIGGQDFMGGEGVCLIEWPERVGGLLPPETIRITIRKNLGRGTDYRLITFEQEETE